MIEGNSFDDVSQIRQGMPILDQIEVVNYNGEDDDEQDEATLILSLGMCHNTS